MKKSPVKLFIVSFFVIVFISFVTVGANLTAEAETNHDQEASAEGESELVNLQLLGITDFHGYLEPENNHHGKLDTPDGQLTVGGAAYMATHLDRLEEGHSNSIRLSAGDDFSGWPFMVEVFKDEPTIEFFNALGLDLSVAGNHEFDRTAEFLEKHMMNGKCVGKPGRDMCFEDSTGEVFQGADYNYLSANIRDAQSGKLVLKPYEIKQIPDGKGGTIPVGFIGLTTPTTILGTTSFQEGALTADGLVESANRYTKELKELGVETIVTVVHEGGSDFHYYNQCKDPYGPVIDFAKEASPEIDAIVTGHWHASFNCSIEDPNGNPRPVVEGANHGKLISEINLMIDPETKDVVREKTTSTNHPVTRDVPKDPEIEQMVSYWKERSEEAGSEPVAKITGDLTRERSADGESTLANVAADAHYAAGKKGKKKPADFALTAESPLDGDLLYESGSNPADSDGTVLFREQFEAHGYANPVVNVTLTGAEIDQILEEQWRKESDGSVSFHPLAVSHNVRYAYDDSKPVGQRVSPEDVVINGKTLEPDRSYRVAALAYLIRNGDGYETFLEYKDPVRIQVDYWAFLDYLKAQEVIEPPKLNRVSSLN
ncbi:bifunctional metallophosphatase/5'-nucleotidase [Thalassobacillus pellis]|uniref:bifunctional metallophosphatase/5'-nucleotidase n=1 Tax=Thalassobacillus pellis TaxID=748008 RepID=UPI0019612F28|nr:bifunctional metallophosphatase/5'-nucleotidase [Thalassobacillus pellis]MBM7551582.1 5'-nucleotidase [Thalassobacillus pellis]